MMDSKRWWESKTIWVNLIALLAFVPGMFGRDVVVDVSEQEALIAGVLAAINIGLRIASKSAVRLSS